MIQSKILLKAITLFVLIALCQNSIAQSVKEFAEKKDTQSITMVRLYNTSQFDKLKILFPNYKQFTTILDSVKLYSKSKYFRMRPNYLSDLQGEKTKIILSMFDNHNNVVDFLIIFTSNTFDSQIESIRKDNQFNKPSAKGETIEIKSDN